MQMRAAVAGGSPTSVSSRDTIPTDIAALWQKALRRGYARSRRSVFQCGAGRAAAAAPPRPKLPRSMSLTALPDAGGPLAGGSPVQAAALTPQMRYNSSMPMLALASPPSSMHGSMRGVRPGAGAAAEPRHQRAVAQEQLQEMMEEDMLTDTGAAADLHCLEQEASA